MWKRRQSSGCTLRDWHLEAIPSWEGLVGSAVQTEDAHYSVEMVPEGQIPPNIPDAVQLSRPMWMQPPEKVGRGN